MKKLGSYKKNLLLFTVVLLLITAGTSCSDDGSFDNAGKPSEILASLSEDLPESIQETITSKPALFAKLVRRVLETPEEFYRLVDKDHRLPPNYEPDNLVYLRDYPLSLNRNDLQVSERIIEPVLALSRAAESEGVRLVFSSAYRSYSYQENVYNRHVDSMGEEEAKRVSAPPGASQHQLGTVVDFGSITPAFENTDAGQWMLENAGSHGFSLSYPENMEKVTGYRYEVWHYRYIGKDAVRLQNRFFEGIQQYMLEFLNAHGKFIKNEELLNIDVDKKDD
ncbi:MAG: M15 family metallopeptidase [Spirochaetales bacterium]|nr:M15 family metallopeptidase [Spirochaetales bacterium]MCF7938225.1 M15 family metallopeptidase [Spirochaetales bacterium]